MVHDRETSGERNLATQVGPLLTKRGLGASIIGIPLLGCAGTSSLDQSDRIAPYRTPFKYERLVVSKSGVVGAFDEHLVDCPFVFERDGRFYMLFVGHDRVGYQTGLAVSDDLVNWEKIGLIFGRDERDPYRRYNAAMSSILRDDDIASSATLKRINGRYLATWHAYPEAGYEEGPAVIGLAWSDDLIHWECLPPVLRAEDGADWERGGLYKSYLLEADGVFYLFYNAKEEGPSPREQWGVATSRDLETWTRFAGNPLIRNGAPGSPDDTFASDPVVVRHGQTWAAFYFGLSSDGHARELLALGRDPFHFEKIDEVMIDVGPPGSIDALLAHKPGIISWQGDLYHFYTAVARRPPDAGRGITVARSRPWD